MHIGYDIDGVISKKDPTHISRKAVRVLVGLFYNFFPKVIKNWTLNREVQIDINIGKKT